MGKNSKDVEIVWNTQMQPKKNLYVVQFDQDNLAPGLCVYTCLKQNYEYTKIKLGTKIIDKNFITTVTQHFKNVLFSLASFSYRIQPSLNCTYLNLRVTIYWFENILFLFQKFDLLLSLKFINIVYFLTFYIIIL